MINWILIVILVLAGFIAIRFLFSSHAKHRLKLTLILIFVLFFISTFYIVASSNNIDITSINGLGNGVKAYGGWVVHSFANIRALSGAAVGLDWKGNNITSTPVSQQVNPNTNSNTNTNSYVASNSKTGASVVETNTNSVKPNTPKPITTYK